MKSYIKVIKTVGYTSSQNHTREEEVRQHESKTPYKTLSLTIVSSNVRVYVVCIIISHRLYLEKL